ncbi:hypothetical protein ES708_12305 [subsurface metagenome]
MDQFLALYMNELRNMKRGLLIILAIIIGYILLVSIYPFQLLSYLPVSAFLLGLGMKLFYLFPVLFAYSLYMEEKNRHLSQAGSPLEQARIHIGVKYFIIVDAMIVMTVIIFLHAMLMMSDVLPHPKTSGHAQTQDPRVIISSLCSMFNGPFILVSLVCTAWGVMKTVKRFRILFGLAVMAVGWLLYYTLFGLVASYGKTFAEIYSYALLLTLCCGGIFCVVGILLWKRMGRESRG